MSHFCSFPQFCLIKKTCTVQNNFTVRITSQFQEYQINMARGQQKIQAQQKNQLKNKKKKGGSDQKASALKALVYTCTVCKVSGITSNSTMYCRKLSEHCMNNHIYFTHIPKLSLLQAIFHVIISE